MARYRWTADGFVDFTGKPMEKPYAGKVVMPMIRSDLPAYKSPITGEVIEGRSARREDLKKHGCREVDPSEFKGGLESDKFARKLHDGKKRRGEI